MGPAVAEPMSGERRTGIRPDAGLALLTKHAWRRCAALPLSAAARLTRTAALSFVRKALIYSEKSCLPKAKPSKIKP